MQNKPPIEQYYYLEAEWTRLGCGPLPPERNREQLRQQSHQEAHAKGNPKIDGKNVKGHN